MEAFRRIFGFVSGFFTVTTVDVIKKLPTEISGMIFSMLDNRSLRYAATVSLTWRGIAAFEQRRRKTRVAKRTKHKLTWRLPVQFFNEASVTFDVNERVGCAVQQNLDRSRKYLRASDNFKDKKNIKMYKRNIRF
ncbi:hypothetical protein ALC56_08255 [Trachymyrmex septentrionalis]|uniref:F-box domain-containing protein n=1 Tax=Trachymyrmex septentrionalis TaxID=34720 RepID=A0A151JV34_9HYME|nr:hypothetical protein ALC56_08255 [Trachymyrmex septentrionalis]